MRYCLALAIGVWALFPALTSRVFTSILRPFASLNFSKSCAKIINFAFSESYGNLINLHLSVFRAQKNPTIFHLKFMECKIEFLKRSPSANCAPTQSLSAKILEKRASAGFRGRLVIQKYFSFFIHCLQKEHYFYRILLQSSKWDNLTNNFCYTDFYDQNTCFLQILIQISSINC